MLGHRRHVEEQVGGREWGGIFLIVFVRVRAKRETSEIQINVLKYKRQLVTYGLFLSLPFPKMELVLFYT